MSLAVYRGLVAVVIGLERAFRGDTDVICLELRQLGQLHSQLFEVKSGDFFVEFLRKHVHAHFELIRIGPKSDLSQSMPPMPGMLN